MPTPALRKVAFEGRQVAWLDQGAGDPALVFVHGALCDHTDWDAQIRDFGVDHRVLAPDLPGHGASDLSPEAIGVVAYGRMLRNACLAFGLRHVVLVGHSMACRAVLEAAAGEDAEPLPGLRGLVLVDGAYLVSKPTGSMPPERRAVLAEEAYARAAALYADMEPADRARRGIAQMFFDDRHASVRERMIARARSLPSTTARTLMPDFARWDVAHMEETLARIHVPVLALVCTHMNAAHQRVQLDAHTRTPWMQALERYLPRLTLERIEGAGHFPMIEQPARVNALVAAWLQSLPPVGTDSRPDPASPRSVS